MTVVVADASPLIAFQQIGQLHLLQALFTSLLVPPAVAQEVAPSVIRPSWIVERHLAAACGYVLLNPVTAGLVRSFEDWAWSGDHRLEARLTAHNGYELLARA